MTRASRWALGAEQHLSGDWLNDAAKGFMPGTDDDARTYPPSMLLPRHRYIVNDVAGRAAERREQKPDHALNQLYRKSDVDPATPPSPPQGPGLAEGPPGLT